VFNVRRIHHFREGPAPDLEIITSERKFLLSVIPWLGFQLEAKWPPYINAKARDLKFNLKDGIWIFLLYTLLLSIIFFFK
jgi:hypothetical protein